MLMSAPVASAENAGPIAILRRSWELTAGNWWRLFAFIAMIVLAALVLALAVRTASGILIQVALGPPQPMSTSALVIAIILALLNAVLTVVLAVMLARIYAQLAGRQVAP
jgi:ABC-type Fe3+ transport system permease subunit